MADSSISQFVALQRELLALELKSEEEEEKSIAASKKKKDGDDEATSRVLRSLDVQQVSVGLYGRTVVTLATQHDAERLLPPHRFTTGDEVQILSKFNNKKDNSNTAGGGVVSVVGETFISIALFGKNHQQKSADDQGEEEETIVGTAPFTLVPKSSVDVHNRLIRALTDLERHGTSHALAGRIVKAAFSSDAATPSVGPDIEPFNQLLDGSQREAIAFSLTDDRVVSLIHGPPGTGKTSTVAELIQQAVHKFHYKVLVTAPSNVAVDNVLERIVQAQALQPRKRKDSSTPINKRIRAIRLGHPARIKSSILPYSLEAQVQSADGTEIVADVRRELHSFLQILTNPKSRGADKRKAYQEVKALRKEVRERETKVVQQLMKEAQVVLATTVGAANRILNDVEFDLVIIDEAAQALEASCWIPILRGKRLVLAGDHCQLPPTIKSNDPAVQKGLAKTLFERIMELYNQKPLQVSRMLKVQYRMHEVIANWASSAMYHGELQTHESVRSRKLADLPHVSGNQPALFMIDTAGCAMDESVNAAGSRFNEGEAQLVVQHVKTLLSIGLKAEEIAVISPYNGQVELLRTLLLQDTPKLEIRSVDGFQGGEREAVVLSLVRSNNTGVIGFLKDKRRLNVAVTRAKRHCAVICDANTVSQNEFISGLVDWMDEYGEYHSAIEFQDTDLKGDLEHAEAELLKLVVSAGGPTGKPVTSNNGAQPKGLLRGRNDLTKAKDLMDKSLMDRITKFVETGCPGQELVLSSELSRNDRRLVHEQATELGLDHQSEGVDGVDRHMILRIPKSDMTSEIMEGHGGVSVIPDSDNEGNDEGDGGKQVSRPAAFAALNDDDDDESDVDDEAAYAEAADCATKPPPSGNQLLGNLALERRQREQSARANASVAKQAVASSSNNGKKKKKKKGGQKLGGGGNKVAQQKDSLPDDMDEMDFLDAQINKVQNSHGRKVVGTGGYKTLINGILISKPQAPVTKKDPRATSTLNTKLKNAQEGRRAKGGKKK